MTTSPAGKDRERRQMPATLVERLRSTDVDVVLVAALEAANELERTRDAVLEEAAARCDKYADDAKAASCHIGAAITASACARAIRALKSGATDE